MKELVNAISTAIISIKGFAKYLFIPTGAIMFAPDNWLERFRLLHTKNLYGTWVAVIFGISFTIILVDFIIVIMNAINYRLRLRRNLRIRIKGLHTLNNTEKSIIKSVYDNDNYTHNYTNASVRKLEAMHVIFRPEASQFHTLFSYTLQPWVRQYLAEHPSYFSD